VDLLPEKNPAGPDHPLAVRIAPAIGRRALLGKCALTTAPLLAALLGGCAKPSYDRDRGLFVFSRRDK